jgi:hypothetical protein
MGLLRRINQHNGRLQHFSDLTVMLFKDTYLLDQLNLRDGMSSNKQQFCRNKLDAFNYYSLTEHEREK